MSESPLPALPSPETQAHRHEPSSKRWLAFVLCLIAALLVAAWFRPDQSLSPAALRALFILVLAVLLWMTDVIPAFAVGILVIALNVALLGKPQGVFAQTDTDWEQFVQVFGHPLIWLFFGGFVLAAAMERVGLDRLLALGLLRRAGSRYSNLLLGAMLATFVLSMFMSNTATTAMMLAVLTPMLRQCPSDSNLAKGLPMGIAVASNLGGMASLIGTPPNAIAVAALAKLDPPQVVTFLDWLLLGFPPALAAMLLIWRVLVWMYPCGDVASTIDLSSHVEPPTATRSWQFVFVCVTLLATIGLWLTSSWHGIPSAAVSLLPIVLFTSTGLLSAKDIRGLNYDVLFLMAGGLALGNVVTSTGLSDWIVDRLPIEGLGLTGLVILVTYMTVLLSNFMSNTAAANILIPLVVTMAPGAEATIAIAVALAASCAMCLPVATPSNAMVFATGRLRTSDFVKVGLVMGVIAPLLALAWLWLSLDRIL